MKPVISLFSMALIVAFALITECQAQFILINANPINPPIQIPRSGGNFDYTLSVTNNGGPPQQVMVWCVIMLPDSSVYGPVFGPVSINLLPSQTMSRQRTQFVPPNAPQGNYTFYAYVGIYPNNILDSDSFPFWKLSTGGMELWVSRYNGPGGFPDKAQKIAVDSLRNVYVTGYSASQFGYPCNYDYATIKYDSSGNQLWLARYNGTGNGYDQAYSLAVDGNGNVYVTGNSEGNGTDDDYATIKYDSSGNQLWEARFDGSLHSQDIASDIKVDGLGNVYVTGHSHFDIHWFDDCATIKYDSLGNQQWVAIYNGPENYWDGAVALVIDEDSNVFITGYSYSSATNDDWITIKYNSNGMQQWIAYYNGPDNGDDYTSDLALDRSGNIYVTGRSEDDIYSSRYTTIKYNSDGEQLWIAYYTGSGWAHAIAVDSVGNAFVTGTAVTIKYNSEGIQQWVAPNGSYMNDVAIDVFGNVVVTGGSYDYNTIKFNSSGVQQWQAIYNYSGAGQSEVSTSIVFDEVGDVYVTGYSYGYGTYDDYATIKYSGGNLANWQPVEAVVFGVQEPVTEYQLQPCYPNPFNATTAISYELRAASYVSLRVYDSAGRLVETLVDGWREAGMHELTFDAGDLPSGVYFCKMQARMGAYAPGTFTAVQKLMLVK